QFQVVAVVGDGALTCGLSYEGLNNAGHSDRDIILVLNDNGMSIAPNLGAMHKALGSIVATPLANRVREKVKHAIEASSKVLGKGVVEFSKKIEEGVKNMISAGMLFEELGFRYFGPIDGHDIDGMLRTFELVKGLKGPRMI